MVSLVDLIDPMEAEDCLLDSNRWEGILVSLLIPTTDTSAVFNFSSFVGINKSIKRENCFFVVMCK